MVPVLFGIGVYQVDVIVARRFLSELPIGSQSYFTFAMRICDFPQGIFVMALQAATLPSLAQLAARGDRIELARTVSYGLRLSLFVAVPATVALVVLKEPVVVMLLQRGAFDATAARETAQALAAQALGIWAVAGVRQLVSAYYVLGDTRTAVLVSALDFLAFVALALWLRGPFGHVGVSLAVAGSSCVQLILLWWWLRPRLPTMGVRELASSTGRTILASLVAGGIGLGQPVRDRWVAEWRCAPATAPGVHWGRAISGHLPGGGVATPECRTGRDCGCPSGDAFVPARPEQGGCELGAWCRALERVRLRPCRPDPMLMPP